MSNRRKILHEVLAPYLTLGATRSYSSPGLTTDRLGYRASYHGDRLIDCDTWWHQPRKGLVLGNCYPFGPGASHDSATLVSVLSTLTDVSFLNLAIRGANSTQELISAIPFISDCQVVVWVTGANDLLLHLQHPDDRSPYGPFVGQIQMSAFRKMPLKDLVHRVATDGQDLSGVSCWKLVSELSKKFIGKKLLSEPKSQMLTDSDWERSRALAVERALSWYRRDLRLLKRLTRQKTPVVLVANPIAYIARGELVAEEKNMIERQEAFPGRSAWKQRELQLVKHEMPRLWPEFSRELEKLCLENEVSYQDLNKVQFEGFCFVDSVHMNDSGYSQAARSISKLCL